MHAHCKNIFKKLYFPNLNVKKMLCLCRPINEEQNYN